MKKIKQIIPIIFTAVLLLSGCEKHTHDYKNESVSEADCSKTGLITYLCSCGDTYSEIIPTDSEHTWDGGTVSAEMNCVTDGVTVFTCTVCETEKNDITPADGVHSFGDSFITKDATCAEEGLSVKACTVCGAEEAAAIPILAEHTWDSGTVSAEMNCITDGVTVFTCTVCETEKEEVTPSDGVHSFGDSVITKDATCAEEGLSVKVCTVCGAEEAAAIPILTEHTWNSGVTTKEPTCAAKGELTYTCLICGLTKTEELAKTESHVWDSGTVITDASCAADGERQYTCTVCQSYTTERIPATGNHPWGEGVVTLYPSCAAYGITTFTCGACGTQKNEPIEKTDNHSWNDGWVSLKATCSKEGVTVYTCLICGTAKNEAIPATGEHIWEKSVSAEPTFASEGVLLYSCQQCDNSYTEAIPKFSVNPDSYGDPTHIRNSNNLDNYLDFRITGNILTITGKIVLEDLEKLWFRCGSTRMENEYSKIIHAESGQVFSVDLSLTHLTEETFVTIHTYQKNGDGLFWSYTWQDVMVVPDANGYHFRHSMVLDHNIEVMKHWIDPRDCLSDSISDEIKSLSNSIVGNETDEYRKLYLLNRWVAENIYYDYDYYYGRSNELFYAPEDVYLSRRSVCAGYARLLKALVQAQGIPCMEVSTYSAGVSTIGYFDESNYMTEDSNHAHVEAYLAAEDRWVTMDPTWDSGNKYENGEFIPGSVSAKYFDMTLDFFSYTHKILERNH